MSLHNNNNNNNNNNNKLYTIVNGVTGHVDGSIILEAFPYLDALFELDEIYDGELSQALEAGDLSGLVVISPGAKINPSSLMDESALKDTKIALGARSGSVILKKKSWNPSIHCLRISGRGV